MLEPFRPVHLINPLWDARGGSELRTLSLFNELTGSGPVRLWTEYRPDPLLEEKYPIRRVVGRRLRFPKVGTFVFVGAYAVPRRWIYLTRPRRVIIIYNTPDPHRLKQFLTILGPRLRRPVEVVYASEALKRAIGYPGIVQPSPIDLDTFVPSVHARTDTASRSFVVGRLSRDIPEKHHASDGSFYRRLAGAGIGVRIMGGSCLEAELICCGNQIELLPVGAVEPQRFLQNLNCFFYRTAHEWVEPFGRVVMEAMACAVPVVCGNRGGYAQVIEHGRNGFLFERDDEAFEIIQRLRNDPELARTIGSAGRQTVEQLYSSAWRRETVDYYRR